MRSLIYLSLAVASASLCACGATDFVNYAVDSYHETQEGFDNRYGEGSHENLMEGKLECTMCDGSGECSECDGDGCVYCDGTGECPHCDGKGYTQEVDMPEGVGEVVDVLDALK